MNTTSVPLVRAIPCKGRLAETLGLAAPAGREKGYDSKMSMLSPYEPCRPCRPLHVIRSSRQARRLAEQERRREALLAAIGAVLVLLAFALAGTVDYQDRVRDLSGGKCVPSPSVELTW